MIPFTTLKKLREAEACTDSYKHLKCALGKNYGDDTPIPLVKILETNGLTDALWVPESAVSGDDIATRYRLFAVACCQDILYLMNDPRSREAVKTVHLFAHGEASEDALNAARSSADSARSSAWSAARSSAYAAWSAARSAADSAWSAAGSSADSAWSAARNSADSARSAQSAHFKIIFGTEFD